MFLAYIDVLFLQLGFVGMEKHCACGVGSAFGILYPDLQLLRVYATVVEETGFGVNVGCIKRLDVGQICCGIG